MKFKTEFKLFLGLFSLAGILYYIDFYYFGQLNSIIDNFLLQLAFLPIYIFFATVIFDQLLSIREKHSILKKLNMVIGAFFSEMGNWILFACVRYDKNVGQIKRYLEIDNEWTDKDFKNSAKLLSKHNGNISLDINKIQELKKFLKQSRLFLTSLISNPNLMEHEEFTELLWAVFHLSDELNNRRDISSLSDEDIEHLQNDINRVYNHILCQWVFYIQHLKQDYPYLFNIIIKDSKEVLKNLS